MYTSEQQRHYPSRAYVLARRIGRPSSERRIFMMVAFVLGSISAMLTGPVLTNLSIAPQHLTDNLVNRLHKADRLDTATFAQRWNGIPTTVTHPPQRASMLLEI